MKQLGYFMFAKCWELRLIYQNQVFDFLRTVTMNSKNLPDNQCLLLITTKHWLEPNELIYEDLKNLHAAAECHNNLTTRLERWEKNSWRTGIHNSLLLHMGNSKLTNQNCNSTMPWYLQKFKLLVTFSEKNQLSYLKNLPCFENKKSYLWVFLVGSGLIHTNLNLAGFNI